MIEKRKYPYFAMQTWQDVFFLHWPIDEKRLRPYVPYPLAIDTFAGKAYISVICLIIKNNRLPLFSFPMLKQAVQINVRTYVRLDKEKETGVYFFNLYTDQLLPILGARTLMNLPFHYVKTSYDRSTDQIDYTSWRKKETLIDVSFQKKQKLEASALTKFLTERYAIWNVACNRIIKIPIMHSKWQIGEAEANIKENQLHPLIETHAPSYVHWGNPQLAYLYPYEKVAYLA